MTATSKVQAYESKLRLYFLFILELTTTKSIQFINKPVFLFKFFPCCCFGLISKAATTKPRQFIYDLSMLCLGLADELRELFLGIKYFYATWKRKIYRLTEKSFGHQTQMKSDGFFFFVIIHFSPGKYSDFS
jgi:hypothetical protein